MLSYEQNDDGALAWVLESFFFSRQGPVWLKIPVARKGNAFTLSGMLISIPENSEFSFNVENKSFTWFNFNKSFLIPNFLVAWLIHYLYTISV